LLFFIIPATLLLSGCATYSFQKGQSPYNKGYVAARYGRVIPEYTLGKDNSVPDEQIARERFRRRRVEVESYYKQMGYIENRFKQMFVDPPVFIVNSIFGGTGAAGFPLLIKNMRSMTKAIPAVLLTALIIAGPASAGDMLFYKEVNLIGGYSSADGWVGETETLSNSTPALSKPECARAYALSCV